MRPIDADELLRHQRKMHGFGISTEDDYWTFAVHATDIKNAPTIDPESLRPQGEWEAYPSDRYRRCSHCKTEWEKEKIPRIANYCPYCGARMRPLHSPTVTASPEGKPLGDEKGETA